MLEFYCPNRKNDGTPVISDLQVMAYAEAQIGDYDSELLRNPRSSMPGGQKGVFPICLQIGSGETLGLHSGMSLL